MPPKQPRSRAKQCPSCKLRPLDPKCTYSMCADCCVDGLPPEDDPDATCADRGHHVAIRLKRDAVPAPGPDPPARNCTECEGPILRAETCGRCALHCATADCAVGTHAEMRRLTAAAAAVRGPCALDRSEVGNDHDGVCPCGAPLIGHPKVRAGARQQAGEPAAEACVSAKAFGISAQLFAVHPVSLSVAQWRDLLGAIRGRSDDDIKRDAMEERLKRTSGKEVQKVDDDGAVRRLIMDGELPGGRLREFAGLLAAMTAVATFNAAQDDESAQIRVARSAVVDEGVGHYPAQLALNEAAVARLQREGRLWMADVAAQIREEHRADAIHYVKIDTTKGKRKVVSWPDRFVRVIFQSYRAWLAKRPPTWRHGLLSDYLCESWSIPVRNSAVPADLTAMLVQVGVLALLSSSEKWEVLGQSLDAVEAHIRAAAESFQVKFILTASNVSEYKRYVAEKVPDALTQTRGRGGGGAAIRGRGDSRGGRPARGGGGRGPAAPQWAPPAGGPLDGTPHAWRIGPGPPWLAHTQAGFQAPGQQPPRGSQPAGSVPAAHALPPGTPVYLRCTAPGCMSNPPPAGFATTPFCRFHMNTPAQQATLPGPGANGGKSVRTF